MRSLKKSKKVTYIILIIISIILIINLGSFLVKKYKDSLKPKNKVEKKLTRVKDEDITDLLITIADANDYKACYNNSLHNYLINVKNYNESDAYNIVLKYAINNKTLTSDFKIKKSNLEKIFNYYNFNFSFKNFINYLKTNNLVIESEKDYTFNNIPKDTTCTDAAYHDINFWYGNYDDIKSNKKSNLITMKDIVFLNDDTTQIYYFVFEKNNNSYKLKDIIKHFNWKIY